MTIPPLKLTAIKSKLFLKEFGRNLIKMKLASWNVNSLRSNEDKFLKFVDDYQPDILLLQEVRASSEQLSMFLQNINGYTFLNNYSGRPGYGGTAVYYKNNLVFDQITLPGLEGRTIILT